MKYLRVICYIVIDCIKHPFEKESYLRFDKKGRLIERL